MEKHRKESVEFRYCAKPGNEPVLAFMGEQGIRHYSEGLDYLHFHNLMEIGFCHWGSGQMVVNNTIHEYTDGTFTLIPQHILHNTNSKQLCHWDYLFFDVKEIVRDCYYENSIKAEKVIQNISQSAGVYHINEDKCMGEIVKMIFKLMKEKKDYYSETVKGLLLSLVMQLAEQNLNKTDIFLALGDGSNKIIPSLEYISQHYSEEIRISDLARHCNLSEAHFRRIFEKDMGMTPVEYINLVRIQAACDLIRKHDIHMADVAMRVGYQAISTFNRNFGKVIGNSPYQWKKLCNKE